jgi:hypothetical protein
MTSQVAEVMKITAIEEVMNKKEEKLKIAK